MAVNDWYTQGQGYPLGPVNNPYNNYGLGNLQQSRQLMAPDEGLMGQLGNQPVVDERRIPDRITSPNRPSIPGDKGIMQTIKGWTTPALSLLKKIGGQRSPENQAFYDAMGGKSIPSGQFAGGTYGGNKYELYKSPSGVKVGSDIIGWGQGYEKNLDSAFGSRSIEEMEQKTIDWALGRMEKFKGKGHGRGISTRLFNALIKRGVIDQSGDRIGTPTDTVTTDTTRAGWTPDPGRTYTDRDLSRIGREHYTGPGMAFEARPSRTFTTPSGKRGYSGGRAEGGRIGYQEGELVEDESMFEATPTGMVEENIEEVQGEPSREQLEAIAFEIFQLPLEELNEEQLEVVYQAAMEQEPSEEEVQFAAQEGPGEGIASLV